jgi:hypothetical protein
VQSRLAHQRRRPDAPSRRPRRPSARAWACAALVALSSAAGCAHRNAAGARGGERYRAGSPRFDAYVADVRASRRDVDAAAERRHRARGRLAHGLGLGPDASPSMIARALRERAERWRRRGLDVRVDPTGATARGGNGGPVVQSLSSCARTEGDTIGWAGRARRRADDLRARGDDLERHLDDLPAARRPEGRRELRAADQDLRRQADLVTSMERESEDFLATLQEAAQGPPARRHGRPKPRRPGPHGTHDGAPDQPSPQGPPPRDDFDP